MSRAVALELCVTSLESANLAESYQLEGIELCTALQLGGLSPSLTLLKQVRKIYHGELAVLVRPRAGNFTYSSSEQKTIIDDIKLFIDHGADTIVVGCLAGNMSIDIHFLTKIINHSYGVKICFHRAFDLLMEPMLGLNILINMGIDRILTSGGARSAIEGTQLLSELIASSSSRIEIMPGAGINETNALTLVSKTGANRIHFSLSNKINNPSDIMDLGYQETIDENKLSDLIKSIRI